MEKRISMSSDTISFAQPRIGSDRNFGFVFAAFFILISLWPLAHGGTVRIWLLPVAASILGSAVFAPWLLGPLNRRWFRFGLMLGKVMTPIVMGLLFYLTITPVALLMRFLRKDPLRLKRDAATATYWLPRAPPGPGHSSLRKQF
jgi:hypothetical protein